MTRAPPRSLSAVSPSWSFERPRASTSYRFNSGTRGSYNPPPLIERLLTGWPSLPRGFARPLSLITLIVWAGTMTLVVRKATEQTALALTSELAAYGERARWSGIYYRGEKIGFSVSQVTERPGGLKLQE